MSLIGAASTPAPVKGTKENAGSELAYTSLTVAADNGFHLLSLRTTDHESGILLPGGPDHRPEGNETAAGQQTIRPALEKWYGGSCGHSAQEGRLLAGYSRSDMANRADN